MRRVSVQDIDPKGVGLGVATGYGLGLLWGFLAAFLVFRAAPSPEEYLARMYAPSTMALVTLLGFIFAALGGWVAARRVAEHLLLQGVAVGVAMLVLGALSSLIPTPEPSDASVLVPWIAVASWLLTVPAAVLGAAVERARRRRAAGASPGVPDGAPGGSP